MPEPDETLEVERHRPERWWDTAVVAGICCSCCCCCCCCAHSIGAAAGAAAGSVRSLATAGAETRDGALAAMVAYWLGVGLVWVVAIALAAIAEETLLTLLVLVMVAPAVQFLGTFFALPAILLQPTSARRRAAASAVAQTSLGWLVGGLLGGLVMALLAALVVGGAWSVS